MLKNLCKKMFKKSVWVYHCNTGACNGCDIEILNILTPFYDVERFGIKLVASPRHADAMLISGAVTRPTLPLVKRAYEAIPNPKLVFGIGSCATGGGAWFDTYNVTGGVDKALPVNYYIGNDPKNGTMVTWRSYANLLFSNWINYYIYQETPYNIDEIR